MNSRNRDTQNYEIGNLPVDIRERIQKIEEKTGFIPNVFLRLATRHDEFRAFFLYHDALMEKPSGLSRTEKEMIVVSTSATNNCIYCVVDLHAITTFQNPKLLKNNILETTASFLASGLDENKSIIFSQSSVSGHAELAWILNCISRVGPAPFTIEPSLNI